MLYDITTLLAGLILLFFGAEGLVRGAIALSLRMGVSPLVVGLTVLAFSTSSPELVVGIRATLEGSGGIVIGNVIGSNICNTGLILGMAALIFPLGVQRQIIRREIPVLFALTLLFTWFIYCGVIYRYEGIILFIGLLVYVAYSVISAKKSGEGATADEVESVAVKLGRHWAIDVTLLLVGLGVLILGAELMVRGAVSIATMLGASEALIGLTVVAIGTSLPEIATSLVAALKKEGDLLVGNLVAANIFNIGAILGFSSLVAPMAGEGITRMDLLMLLLFSMVLLPIMRTGHLINRSEGGFLVVAYFAYMGYLILQIP